jgi:hypothetical protein
VADAVEWPAVLERALDPKVSLEKQAPGFSTTQSTLSRWRDGQVPSDRWVSVLAPRLKVTEEALAAAFFKARRARADRFDRLEERVSALEAVVMGDRGRKGRKAP